MNQPKILLIEDEADILIRNKNHLKQEGYAVDCAASLAEARLLLNRAPPDLVLLDVMLPDGSGYDFCAEIRAVTAAPVIYLTCLDKNEEIVRGLHSGADDYITKPFDLTVLSARIIAQLRRAGQQGAGRIVIPPLTIDLQKGIAVLAGEVIVLPQKELQILTFFASHPGREFTAEQIYEAVWGDCPEAMGNTVKTRISSLRKKLRLDEEGSPFEIRYPRGRGYVFMRTLDQPEW